MVKIRFFLLLLISFVYIFAGFDILSETNSYIDIKYTPDSLSESKYIILPPDAHYSINIISGNFSVNDISKKAIYFGDLYLLPLLAKDKTYTIRISYTKMPVSGRIIGLSKENNDYFNRIVINNKDILKRIKPRKAIIKKSLYPGTPVVNIKTDSTGIYRVYYDQINNYSDIELSSINPNNIQLFYEGQEIPIYITNIDDGVFNSGDYFEFYAERVKGDSTYFERYNTQNVYVLVVNGNSGARYIEYSSSISDDSLINEELYTENRTEHMEKDSLFRRFTDSLPYDTCDFWYFQAISELDTLLFDENTIHINLLNKDTNSNYINIRAALFGYTKNSYSPDHPVEVYVNGDVIDTIEWDGITYYEYERDSFYWDSSNININFKPLFLASDTDSVSNNSILVNWVEIDYKKDLNLINNRLCFHLDDNKVNGRYRFIIKNLSSANIELYRKNLKKIINIQVEYDSLSNTYTAIFEDDIYSDNREYFIFEDNSMFEPQYETYTFNDLSNINNKGEYIIIVPDDFKSYAEDLGDLFTNGHNVFIATTKEIYNEFSYGLISANAIKEFLVTAYNNWTVPPTHVLFLGDGSKDMNNHLGYFNYQIPVVFAYGIAFFSYVCSDNYYACVSGDDYVEDISVSRYPVRNANDILNLKNKISHYLNNKYYGIQNLRTIIAFDTSDLSSVSSQVQDLKNVLPEYLYADTILNFENYDVDIVDEFNQGGFFSAFVAHGATQSIGAAVFFRIYDVYRMTNLDRLPFVATFSCNTVEFDQLYPDSFTISEAFVVHPFGGSIAFYGATGPSYDNSNAELALYVFKEFSCYNEKNIGNIIKFAELEYYLNGTEVEQQLQNYNLLGVNFVNLNIPDKTTDEVEYVSSPITAGDTIKVIVKNSVINNGIMESILLQKNKYPISHASGEFINGYGENYILTPDTLNIDNYILLTMLRDEDTSIVYVSYPSVGSVSLIDFSINPDKPDTNENYRIKAKFSDSNVLQNVYAFIARGDSNSYVQYNMIEDSLNQGIFYTEEFSPLLPYNTDSYLYYRLQFIDTSNYVYNTTQKKYLIPEKIDFCFNDNNIYLKSLNNRPYIYLTIADLSLRTASVENYFYIFDSVRDSLIGIDTIQPFINKTYSGVFLNKDIFNKKLLIYLDIENKIDEKNEDNNMNVIVFPYKILFVPDTIQYETFYNFNIDVLPINEDTSFISLYRQEINIDDSTGLILYKDSNNIAYEYNFCNYDSNNIDISMFLDSLDDVYNYKLFLYNEKYKQFELIEDSIENVFNYSLMPGENRFLIADYNDSIAPNVNLNIENKEYIDGIVLTKNVKIGCTIEDNSGIKIEDLIILINSDTLDDSCYTILKTTDTKSIPININTQLENGPYNITVIAKDIYNNQSNQTLSFQVTEQFKITHFANYPNPVTGNSTVFAAYLTEDAENIKIKIYNSSGILVDEINIGATQSGIVTFNYNVSSLPNGTYFYYFEAESNDEYDKTRISKMSILR